MQIPSRFTIAVHVLIATDFFAGKRPVTSALLAQSAGVNPVEIRTIIGKLKNAGLVASSRGKCGIALAKSLDGISLYDVYAAVRCVCETGLFHMNEHSNPGCPVGKNINRALGSRLQTVQDAMENQMKAIALSEIAADVKSSAADAKNAGE